MVIYLDLHPETAHGGDMKAKSRHAISLAFVMDMALKVSGRCWGAQS
jgi:hypothetical protein